jgi:hypothetical protein
VPDSFLRSNEILHFAFLLTFFRNAGLNWAEFKSVKEITIEFVKLTEFLVPSKDQALFVCLKDEIFRETLKVLEFFEVLCENL